VEPRLVPAHHRIDMLDVNHTVLLYEYAKSSLKIKLELILIITVLLFTIAMYIVIKPSCSWSFSLKFLLIIRGIAHPTTSIIKRFSFIMI
jgi:hypothetical protein